MSHKNSFYSEDELALFNFESIGKNVLISRKTSIYQPELISIGDNVRIDDFCVLSGKIIIKNYVHIACYCGLFAGKEGIFFDNFSGISSRVTIYSVSDDYSGEFMTNPMIPMQYRHITAKNVFLGKHVIVGAGSIILPGVILNDGVAVGAMSLVTKSFSSWKIIYGNPAKILRNRKSTLLNLEKFLE